MAQEIVRGAPDERLDARGEFVSGASIASTRTSAAILSSVLAGCAATGTPLDRSAPSASPTLFATGVVSTPEAIELNGTLAPDGRLFFFSRRDAPWAPVRTRDVFWLDPRELERHRR